MSRLEISQMKRSTDEHSNNMNQTTIQEHSIMVEMPTGNPAKNSARTGYHHYKGSAHTSANKKAYKHAEESPPRV